MADAADIASEIVTDMVAAEVSRARVPIPAGAAGECERCEWWMPRLVDGLCGFCRDGRPRPPDWEPPTPPNTIIQEVLTMPAKTICLPAAATIAIAAVDARVAETGDAIGVAAAFLIERGAAAQIASAADPVDLDLTVIDAEELLEELARRVAMGGLRGDLERDLSVMTERAVGAERKLQFLRETLAA